MFCHRLGSCEAAFWTFVETAEFAAFAVAFYLDFSTVGTLEFGGFAAWRDGFAAACACDQGDFFGHNLHFSALYCKASLYLLCSKIAANGSKRRLTVDWASAA
jgi:hypothetical protein